MRRDPPGERRGRRLVALLAVLSGLAVMADCTDYGNPVAEKKVPAESVTISGPAQPRLQVGDIVQFTAVARDANGDTLRDAGFHWSSSEPAVAAVDAFGRVTGLAPGAASIRAASGPATSAPIAVVVTPRVATVVVTAPTDPNQTVAVGSFLQFTAEARDAGGAAIPSALITWTVANPAVATIDSTGRAVGIAEGSTTVRAASNDIHSPAIVLTVRPATQIPASILITEPTGPADLLVGSTLAFVAEVRDTAGAVIPGAAVTWQTSDSLVATISAGGIARGVHAGQTDITAAIGALQSPPVRLRVALPLAASVTITGPANPQVAVGRMLQFTAEARDDAGQLIQGAPIAWSSDASGVATIDSSGFALGISPGTANIRATSGSVQSSAVPLTVIPPPPDFRTRVQPIFNNNCVGCHAGAFPTGFMSLEASRSYGQLVDHASSSSPLLRVKPGDPDNSYLYIKLTGVCPGPRCSGSRMPQGGQLSDADIGTIRDWIAGGALP